jgi:hypothetical protein
MKPPLPVYPFDDQRAVGTIIEVGPSSAKLNLPRAAIPSGQWLHGHKLSAGEVGEYLLIEAGEFAVLGRLVNVKLPERERLTVEPELGTERTAHPLGTLQLLATLSIKDGNVSQGISAYPRLGSRVYSAHPALLKWIAETSYPTDGGPTPLVIELGILPATTDTMVNLTPERLFGRHCGLLGATGGGKSWTIARLIEQASKSNAKVLLIDATGEFHTLDVGVTHIQVGEGILQPNHSTETTFPYSELTEGDLFALFTPSGQTQGPKLRAAMKSLKLAKLVPALAPAGLIVKAQSQKGQFQTRYTEHSAAIESSSADFDIKFLSRQIEAECVWPSGGTGAAPDHTRWGNSNEAEKSYCVTLMNRIEEMISSKHLACIFRPDGKPSISSKINAFLDDPSKRVLRISLKHLSFDHHAREIVANAIGRVLLLMARAGKFREHPLVLFLDEAHQFLSKELGDENSRYPLDSFELISKEGRKFCLNICISTQRPRDIPEGVLSQMGTLIVHRLTNDRDREIVERASGEIDRSAAAFLPTLSPGQAIVIGVDFPMPLTIQIEKPNQKPDSKGPDYQKHWTTLAKDTSSTPKAAVEVKPAGIRKPK